MFVTENNTKSDSEMDVIDLVAELYIYNINVNYQNA